MSKTKPKPLVFWVRQKARGKLVTFVGQEEPILYSRRTDASYERQDDERVVKARLFLEDATNG